VNGYHEYFITRLFVREGFYDYEGNIENVVEMLSGATQAKLSEYLVKKCKSAVIILECIYSNSYITIYILVQTEYRNGILNPHYVGGFRP